MAVESAADRAVFVDPDDFGTEATYTPGGGEAVEIDGLFDETPGEVFSGGDVAGMASERPTFTCRTADLPEDAVGSEGSGDQLELTDIDGEDRVFRVMRIMPDNSGMTTLILEEVE